MRLAISHSEQSVEMPVALLEEEAAFLKRREELVQSLKSDPLARLASFLAYLAHANGYSGSRSRVGDDVQCGMVATWLDMTVDDLERNLAILGTLGLIEACSSGALIIQDVDGLDCLADQSM